MQDCQTLTCFNCSIETSDGKYVSGDPGCDEVEGSTRYLKECPVNETQCLSVIGQGKLDRTSQNLFVDQVNERMTRGDVASSQHSNIAHTNILN